MVSSLTTIATAVLYYFAIEATRGAGRSTSAVVFVVFPIYLLLGSAILYGAVVLVYARFARSPG